jgi:hypothetical protein
MDQRVGASSEDLLDTPVVGGRGLSTSDRATMDLSSTIKGWGSDLDPAVRPGVPRDKAPEIGAETLYADMPQQVAWVKIHKSTEHGRLTPVFGTSCPPKGLSGVMRNAAYHYSEGRLAHWMLLLLADRVDVVEEMLNDIVHLRGPRIIKEMGLKSEWKHNRAAVVRNAVVAGVAVGAIVALTRMRRRRRTLMREYGR